MQVFILKKVFLKGLCEHIPVSINLMLEKTQMMMPMEVTQDSVTPTFHFIVIEI